MKEDADLSKLILGGDANEYNEGCREDLFAHNRNDDVGLEEVLHEDSYNLIVFEMSSKGVSFSTLNKYKTLGLVFMSLRILFK